MSAAAAHTVAVHALTVRGIGLAWWEGARIPVARRADSHCTCCGSTQASVARSRITMSVPPLPTLALGRSSKHALQRASRAARSARRLRHSHHQEATCASYRGSAHLGARARSAHAIGAERIARSADQAAAGARARSAHAIGAERVREAAMAAERLRLPRLAHRCAAPSAPSAERRAPSAERRARGGDQARRRRPGAQRPRHRRRARSARRRWLRASGCPTPHTTAGRLLPASATIKKKWVTSPGPDPLYVTCIYSDPYTMSSLGLINCRIRLRFNTESQGYR